MGIVVNLVSAWASVDIQRRDGNGVLTLAVRAAMPAEPVEVVAGYRLRSHRDVRLVPADTSPGPDGVPVPHITGARPFVVPEQLLRDADGSEYDAQIVNAPSWALVAQVSALAPGQRATTGGFRPYRLSDAELEQYAGRTLRLHPVNLDARS